MRASQHRIDGESVARRTEHGQKCHQPQDCITARQDESIPVMNGHERQEYDHGTDAKLPSDQKTETSQNMNPQQDTKATGGGRQQMQ